MGSKKILLCDDDQRITQILEGFFMAKGYDMLTSLTGETALEKVSEHKPDLVIMDLKLPGMNGAEVSKKIKEFNPGIKIIVLSGFSDEYRDELSKIPVDHIMEKPINMRELTSTISDMLAGRPVPGKDKVSGTPKAKLLMLEPRLTAATGFKEYFSNYEVSGGEYDMELSDNRDDFLSKLRSFKPDVLLISVGDENAGKMVSDLIKDEKEGIPNMMISYGLEIHKVAKKVKEICLEKGLVKK